MISRRDGRRTREPRNGRDLDDAERLEPAKRFADRGLARPELARDLGLDDPRARRVAPVEDGLEEPILDLVGKDAAGERSGGGHGQPLSARSRSPVRPPT